MPVTKEIAGQQVISFTATDSRAENIEETFKAVIASNYSDPDNAPVAIYENGEHRSLIGTGAVLSDRQLHVGLEIGHVICDPAPRLINPSSIDVRLGRYFYHAGHPENNGGLFNPFSQQDTLRYFGIKDIEKDFHEAKPWGHIRKRLGKTSLASLEDLEFLEGIPDGHPMILLRPGERILGHTHEFIGILPPGTLQMQGRSTTGRIGISACYDAGWGDPGYINRWTMEINNLNENEAVPLPVGFRLAQLAFYMTGPVAVEYSKASGNYQYSSSSDLAKVKASWHPKQMIPRAFTNEIELPPAVKGLTEGLQ